METRLSYEDLETLAIKETLCSLGVKLDIPEEEPTSTEAWYNLSRNLEFQPYFNKRIKRR